MNEKPRSKSYRFFHPVYLLSSYLSSTKVSSTHFKPRCFHVPSHKTTFLGVNVTPLSLRIEIIGPRQWVFSTIWWFCPLRRILYYCDLIRCAQCSSSSDSTPETPKGRQDLTIRLGKNMGPPYQLARPHVVRFFPSELGKGSYDITLSSTPPHLLRSSGSQALRLAPLFFNSSLTRRSSNRERD